MQTLSQNPSPLDWGLPGHLTLEQHAALDALRARVKGKSLFLQDADLLRFLRARQFRVEAAMEMLMKDAEWRRRYESRRITAKDCPAVAGFARKGCLYRAGSDKDGRPILVTRLALAFPKDVKDTEEITLFWLGYVQQLLGDANRAEHEAWTVLSDFAGFSMFTNFSLPIIKVLIQLLQDHCPENVKRICVVNLPKAFIMGWNLIMPFLDERTRDKIQLLGSNMEPLQRYIAPDQLEARFGGTRAEAYPIPDDYMRRLDGDGVVVRAGYFFDAERTPAKEPKNESPVPSPFRLDDAVSPLSPLSTPSLVTTSPSLVTTSPSLVTTSPSLVTTSPLLATKNSGDAPPAVVTDSPTGQRVGKETDPPLPTPPLTIRRSSSSSSSRFSFPLGPRVSGEFQQVQRIFSNGRVTPPPSGNNTISRSSSVGGVSPPLRTSSRSPAESVVSEASSTGPKPWTASVALISQASKRFQNAANENVAMPIRRVASSASASASRALSPNFVAGSAPASPNTSGVISEHEIERRVPRVAVFGATGRTGVMVVRRLLASGFDVNAFVRLDGRGAPPALLDLASRHVSQLRLIMGKLNVPEDVDLVVASSDVVVSTMGGPQMGAAFPAAVNAVVQSMARNQVKRIVLVTAAQATERWWDWNAGWLDNVERWAFWATWYRFEADAERIVKDARGGSLGSALDFTLVRPCMLAASEESQGLVEASGKNGLLVKPNVYFVVPSSEDGCENTTHVQRSALARFIVDDCVTFNRFHGMGVAVAGKDVGDVQ